MASIKIFSLFSSLVLGALLSIASSAPSPFKLDLNVKGLGGRGAGYDADGYSGYNGYNDNYDLSNFNFGTANVNFNSKPNSGYGSRAAPSSAQELGLGYSPYPARGKKRVGDFFGFGKHNMQTQNVFAPFTSNNEFLTQSVFSNTAPINLNSGNHLQDSQFAQGSVASFNNQPRERWRSQDSLVFEPFIGRAVAVKSPFATFSPFGPSFDSFGQVGQVNQFLNPWGFGSQVGQVNQFSPFLTPSQWAQINQFGANGNQWGQINQIQNPFSPFQVPIIAAPILAKK